MLAKMETAARGGVPGLPPLEAIAAERARLIREIEALRIYISRQEELARGEMVRVAAETGIEPSPPPEAFPQVKKEPTYDELKAHGERLEKWGTSLERIRTHLEKKEADDYYLKEPEKLEEFRREVETYNVEVARYEKATKQYEEYVEQYERKRQEALRPQPVRVPIESVRMPRELEESIKWTIPNLTMTIPATMGERQRQIETEKIRLDIRMREEERYAREELGLPSKMVAKFIEKIEVTPEQLRASLVGFGEHAAYYVPPRVPHPRRREMGYPAMMEISPTERVFEEAEARGAEYLLHGERAWYKVREMLPGPIGEFTGGFVAGAERPVAALAELGGYRVRQPIEYGRTVVEHPPVGAPGGAAALAGQIAFFAGAFPVAKKAMVLTAKGMAKTGALIHRAAMKPLDYMAQKIGMREVWAAEKQLQFTARKVGYMEAVVGVPRTYVFPGERAVMPPVEKAMRGIPLKKEVMWRPPMQITYREAGLIAPYYEPYQWLTRKPTPIITEIYMAPLTKAGVKAAIIRGPGGMAAVKRGTLEYGYWAKVPEGDAARLITKTIETDIWRPKLIALKVKRVPAGMPSPRIEQLTLTGERLPVYRQVGVLARPRFTATTTFAQPTYLQLKAPVFDPLAEARRIAYFTGKPLEEISIKTPTLRGFAYRVPYGEEPFRRMVTERVFAVPTAGETLTRAAAGKLVPIKVTGVAEARKMQTFFEVGIAKPTLRELIRAKRFAPRALVKGEPRLMLSELRAPIYDIREAVRGVAPAPGMLAARIDTVTRGPFALIGEPKPWKPQVFKPPAQLPEKWAKSFMRTFERAQEKTAQVGKIEAIPPAKIIVRQVPKQVPAQVSARAATELGVGTVAAVRPAAFVALRPINIQRAFEAARPKIWEVAYPKLEPLIAPAVRPIAKLIPKPVAVPVIRPAIGPAIAQAPALAQTPVIKPALPAAVQTLMAKKPPPPPLSIPMAWMLPKRTGKPRKKRPTIRAVPTFYYEYKNPIRALGLKFSKKMFKVPKLNRVAKKSRRRRKR